MIKICFFLGAENILVGKSYISAQVILPTPIFPQAEVIPHAQPNLNML